jgi:hypothetical protein
MFKYFVCIFCFIFLFCDQFVVAEVLDKEEIIKHCDLIAMKFKEKRESIRTWQGVVEADIVVYDSANDDKKPVRQVKYVIEFWLDVVKGKRSFISTPLEDIEYKSDGSTITNHLRVLGMLIDDELVCQRRSSKLDSDENLLDLKKTMPGLTHEGMVTNHAVSAGYLVILPKLDHYPGKGNFLEDCNPMVLLQPHHPPMDERFSTFALFVKNNKDYADWLLFEQKGNLFFSKTIPHKGDEMLPLNTFIVDMQKDCSIVGYQCRHAKTGSIIYSWEPEYILQSGILLPDKVSVISGHGTSQARYRFVKSIINSPIPDANFTLQHIGVRQGDTVYDNRTNTESVITDSSFPEALSTIALKRPRFGTLNYLLIGIGTLMLLTGLVRVYIKLRSNKTKQS